MSREIDSFENLGAPAIRGTLEFLTKDAQGAENFTVDAFIAHIAKEEGVGLSAKDEAWLKSVVDTNPVDGGPELPEHAHPDTIFLLTEADGSNTPGVYVRSSGASGSKTDDWTANVAFASDGNGGLVWDRAHGTETGIPDELRSIAIDSEGTIVVLADTDTSLPGGPGDLSVEIHGINSDYGFTTTLYDQPFSAQTDQEITFRGTVDPSMVVGAPYRFVLVSGSNANAYWTPPNVGWGRVALGGTPGAPGAEGEDGFSPVFAVVQANASSEVSVGPRRILKVVDWIQSTGDLEVGYSLFRGSYASGVTYKQGDIVLDQNRFYASLTNSNRGNALANATHWSDLSGGGTGGGNAPAPCPSVLRKVSLVNPITITAGTTAWGDWGEVCTLTVSDSEAGYLYIISRADSVSDNSSGGGDRIFSCFRLVRRRGTVDTVIGDLCLYGPRNLGNASAQFNQQSRQVTAFVPAMDLAQDGDIYKLEARYWGQESARVMTHSAGEAGGNTIQIGRR